MPRYYLESVLVLTVAVAPRPDEATHENIAGEIARILQDSSYAESQRQALLAIRDKLGDRNGSAELARLAADMLAMH